MRAHNKGMLLTAATAALFMAGTASASASASFDPVSNTGTVAASDVGTIYGLTDQQLSDAVVHFVKSDNTVTRYELTCSLGTGTFTAVTSVGTTSALNSTPVSVKAKKGKNTVTSYALTGVASTTAFADSVPAVGDNCPPSADLGTVTSVSSPLSSVRTVSVSANIDGQSYSPQAKDWSNVWRDGSSTY